MYRKIKPRNELAKFVECYFEFNDQGIFKGQAVSILNDGFTEMIIQLKDPTEFHNCTKTIKNTHQISLSGQYIDKIITTPTGHTHIITVNFKPGGMYSIFGIPQYYFESNNISLMDIDPAGGTILLEKLLEQDSIEERICCIEEYLINFNKRNYKPVAEMNYATTIIRNSMGNNSVRAISEELRMSVRSFNRRFLVQVGIVPKQFSELIRLNYVCHDLIHNNNVDLCSLSVNYGYYDPSHLINSFKRYLHITPKGLLSRKLSNGDYTGKITIDSGI